MDFSKHTDAFYEKYLRKIYLFYFSKATYFDILITSPFIRHSFRLSSKTVLRFSIQFGSTGPSKTIH